MSYLFQSRQLHPKDCSMGMGLVGPDQPWTQENKSKVIVEREETCSPGYLAKRMSEFATPKRTVGGEVVENTDCFKTGKVWEARRAGNARHVEWCCPPKAPLPQRRMMREEYEQYGDRCGPKRSASGLITETIPSWRDAESYVGSTCDRMNIFDEGYELVCCPPPHKGPYVLPDMTFHQGSVSPEQDAEWEERRLAQEQEQERQAQEASGPQSTAIARYAFPILLVVGTVGIGVTAALIKRFSVASKKADEAKAAVSALSKNSEAPWWPPRVVGERWEGPPLRPGPELDLVQLGEDFWEVYWKEPEAGHTSYLGTIQDRGLEGFGFYAESPRGMSGNHRNLNDAATWLAQRTWSVVEGDR